MAGTAVYHSTKPTPISPISPTEALKLVLSQDPNRSIHDVAQDLNEWARRNWVRLWCNGNLVPPHFIATSLLMVARHEADGRPRVDVVPTGPGVGWEKPAYNFAFDADEVRARLAQLKSSPRSSPTALVTVPNAAPVPAVVPETPEGTDRWVFEQMRDDPPRKGDHGYVQRLFNRRPDKKIKKKTIANNVGKYREQFETP
jgi:hypothetical protein